VVLQPGVISTGTPEVFIYFDYNKIRMKPIAVAAGTVMFRYAYMPSNLGLADTPHFPNILHHALRKYTDSEALRISRNHEPAAKYWSGYLEDRAKIKSYARQYQRTPDTMLSQRNVTVFNWPYWDYRFRSRK
jgi:hypothetical protein